MRLVPVNYATSPAASILQGLTKNSRIDPDFDTRGRARPGFLATEVIRRGKKTFYRRRQPYNILLGVWVDDSRYNGAALRDIRSRNGVGKRKKS